MVKNIIHGITPERRATGALALSIYMFTSLLLKSFYTHSTNFILRYFGGWIDRTYRYIVDILFFGKMEVAEDQTCWYTLCD
jgi:hypothetical protein